MPLPSKGGKAQSHLHHVASQETGPPSSERKLTVRSFQGEGGRSMFRKGFYRFQFTLHSSIQLILVIAFASAVACTTQAQSANLRGRILDPLGSPVAQAKVVLVREGADDKSSS